MGALVWKLTSFTWSLPGFLAEIMWVEKKMCTTWLHKRIIKPESSTSKNSESIFPAAKDVLAPDLLQTNDSSMQQRLNQFVLQGNVGDVSSSNGGLMVNYINQYLTENSSFYMFFKCYMHWWFSKK